MGRALAILAAGLASPRLLRRLKGALHVRLKRLRLLVKFVDGRA